MPRYYMPMTMALLRRLHETGEVPSEVSRRATGPQLEGDEEAEYAQLQAAADESAGLLGGPGRRVVVVAEVPESSDPHAPVTLRRVVAVHVDATDVDPSEHAYDDPPELGWWATQEIAALLGD